MAQEGLLSWVFFLAGGDWVAARSPFFIGLSFPEIVRLYGRLFKGMVVCASISSVSGPFSLAALPGNHGNSPSFFISAIISEMCAGPPLRVCDVIGIVS